MVEIRFFGNAGLLRQLRLAIVFLVFLATSNSQNLALAQTPAPPPRSELERKLEEQTQDTPSDVVRVRTDLVQTTVSVLNKSGKFIDNLKVEDFELRVDGKPHPVLFFERVVNGVTERVARNTESVNRSGGGLTAPEDKTRTVLFFVDDFHLSSESMLRARKMLSHYVEEEMGPNDQAVIVSASGRIGFLQQVTETKDVLRAALERLTYRAQDSLDSGRPRMSVHQASAIEKGDADVRMYFEDVLIKDMLGDLWRRNPQRAREVAELSTRNRANRIIHQADIITKQTLSALDRAIRSTAQVSGRKLMFFVSDGFLVNNQNPDIRDRLQRITDAAVRVGAVLYTVQASGLNTIIPDASSDAQLIAGSGTGRSTGEDMDLQEPLMELAADSGGKALLNANDLNQSVKSALRQSNDYYLLAWRPESAMSANKFHRIEVTVKGQPDLAVLVQRGFFKEEQPATVIPVKAEKRKSAVDPKVEDLAAAIKGKVSGSLKTSVMANYLDVPGRGARLSVLMRVDRLPSSSQNSGKAQAIDIAGVVYDESGKVVGSFVENLKPENSENQHVAYLNQFDVKPGLYQVRGAARDATGATGMAMQWVKVPDLGARHLTLSSLLIGERELTHSAEPAETIQSQKAQLKIDRRFVSNSRLRFVTFIYNARDEITQAPRLNARVDIFRGNKPVVSTPSLVIDASNVSDPARIPYAGEISLASLARGNYLMRVTVIDLNAKAFASQETAFAIE